MIAKYNLVRHWDYFRVSTYFPSPIHLWRSERTAFQELEYRSYLCKPHCRTYQLFIDKYKHIFGTYPRTKCTVILTCLRFLSHYYFFFQVLPSRES
jgi:hypothetical protein